MSGTEEMHSVKYTKIEGLRTININNKNDMEKVKNKKGRTSGKILTCLEWIHGKVSISATKRHQFTCFMILIGSKDQKG